MTEQDKLDGEYEASLESEAPIDVGKAVEGQLLESKPQDLPQIVPKSGYTTSQGHFTGIFTVVALVLAVFGYHYSSEQIDNYAQLIDKMASTIGPIVAIIPVLVAYINSRGKIQSNSLWASASLSTGVAPNAVVSGQPGGFAGLGSIVGGLGNVLGGKNWKDPGRYIDIIDLASKFGVPETQKISGAIHSVRDSANSGHSLSDKDITDALELLGKNQEALNSKLDTLLARK